MDNSSGTQSAYEATASDSPLIQGRNAREYGHGRDSCPYPEGSIERQGWMDGFDDITADDLEAGGVSHGRTRPNQG